MRIHSRSGLSALEVIIALSLLALVSVNIGALTRTMSRFSRSESSSIVLEDHARIVLDRITLTIMSADRETLVPDTSSPLYAGRLSYRVNLGLRDGEVVWGDDELISLSGDGTELLWRRNPEETDELRVVWSRLARPLLEGEERNGRDDNGNGLIDESGLTFTIDRDCLRVQITLWQPENGAEKTVTLESRVTCRNR